jgi:hypothetical protein
MADKEKYEFTRKVAKILAEHGVDAAEVTDLRANGQAGIRVVVGAYSERISGVISRDALAALAERIKAAT